MTQWLAERKVPIALVLAFVSALLYFGRLDARTGESEKDICEIKTSIKAVEIREHARDERLARIETKLDWLVQDRRAVHRD